MKNVVFMFGAGAEMDFGQSGGNSFMRDTIFSKKSHIPTEIASSLKINETLLYDKYFKKRIICNLMMQYINLCELKGEEKLYKDLDSDEKGLPRDTKKKIFSIYKINKSYVLNNLGTLNIKFDVGEKKDFIENKDKYSSCYDDDKLEKILDEFLRLNDSKCKGETKLDGEYKKIFEAIESNEIKVCADGIDKYFVSINNPKKYGINNYSKIVNLYWSIYYTITKDCLKQFKNLECLDLSEDCLKLSKKTGDLELNDYTINDIIKINKFIQDKDNILKVHKVESNYYSEIFNHTGELKDYSFKAITTNYTPFAYLMFQSKSFSDFEKSISYLNGRLDMFENFDQLSIKSCLSDDKKINAHMKKSFPFLLAQSMIKPVIHPYQIKEFHKATTFLEGADYLVILGYGLNEDDNHVNALLKEYIVEKMTVIIVVKNEDEETSLKNNKIFKKIYERLKFVHFMDNKMGKEDENTDNELKKENKNIIDEIFAIIKQ